MASHVNIYSGERTKESDGGMEMREIFKHDYHFSRISSFTNKGHKRYSPELLAILWQLLQHPWWKQAWAVQEVVHARTARSFCGKGSVLWDDLTRAYAWMHHLVDCCADHFTPIDAQTAENLLDLYAQNSVSPIQEMREKLTSEMDLLTILGKFLSMVNGREVHRDSVRPSRVQTEDALGS
ncbi:MAG: hypothetical protein M1830_009073 [Pleopsidium flavum]|nr:MAG: hypothetical protein M1830_009073 [Pleopsidium flavum]